jgi:hypothetical protein
MVETCGACRYWGTRTNFPQVQLYCYKHKEGCQSSAPACDEFERATCKDCKSFDHGPRGHSICRREPALYKRCPSDWCEQLTRLPRKETTET